MLPSNPSHGATLKPFDPDRGGDIEKSEVDVLGHRGGSQIRSWVAICAAYLVVVQALFAGFAAGTYANALSFDRTLALTHCAPSGDAPARSDHEQPQGHASMSCCTAGCPLLVVGEPARSDVRILQQRPADFVAFARRLDRPVGFLSDYSPGNPRAPPAFA